MASSSTPDALERTLRRRRRRGARTPPIGDLADDGVAGLVAEGGLLADLKNLYRGRALPVSRWTL